MSLPYYKHYDICPFNLAGYDDVEKTPVDIIINGRKYENFSGDGKAYSYRKTRFEVCSYDAPKRQHPLKTELFGRSFRTLYQLYRRGVGGGWDAVYDNDHLEYIEKYVYEKVKSEGKIMLKFCTEGDNAVMFRSTFALPSSSSRLKWRGQPSPYYRIDAGADKYRYVCLDEKHYPLPPPSPTGWDKFVNFLTSGRIGSSECDDEGEDEGKFRKLMDDEREEEAIQDKNKGIKRKAVVEGVHYF